MSESHVCPECGARLYADAPEGLCPKCLMGAAVAETSTKFAFETENSVEDRRTEFGPSPVGPGMSVPAAPVELGQFKRAVLELGLIPAPEFERFVTGALGGVQGLARALVLAGKLTPYQAGALAQGKARGLVIGNYFILDKLGAGGMGVVFKARHRRLGRVVALKILPPSLARDNDLLSRFRREVDVAAKLSHPNIVTVLDADEDRGVQFMTMEYIKGNDLDRLVRDGGVLPVDLALDCTIQAARGLEAAHAQGIVHRDIKPGNLMLDESGVVRVLDLGLARLVEASNPFGESAAGPLTQSGTYMGTVDFMAPEQGVDSRRVDHRADIYSLGCTLCYLLTGRAPFDGANILARLIAHQERSPALLLAARPDVPKAIDAVYQKMMAKKAQDRPASMTDVIKLLEACRSPAAEAGEARAGLKTFAESVVLNRAAPKRTSRDSPIFKRDEPFEVSVGPDPNLQDVLFDNREKNPPAEPAAPTVILEPSPVPNRAGSTTSRRLRTSRLPAFALGVLALLGMVGLGILLISRSRPGTPDGGVNPPAPRAAQGDVTRTPELVPEASWVSLFNGKDLTGWRTTRPQLSRWRVKDGVLTASYTKAVDYSSYLYTERGDFRDFHLRLEARIHENGNSGVYFRSSSGLAVPVNNPKYPGGFEAQINVAKNKGTQTGGLYENAKVVVHNRVDPVRPMEWFTMDVIAEGKRIVVKVNDKITAEFTDEKPSSGHIALQQNDPQSVVEFRKIEIKDLHAAPVSTASATFDVATLFSEADSEVRAIAVTSDGRRLLFGGDTRFARLVDVDSGKEHLPSPGYQDGFIHDVAMTPDGRFGLVGISSPDSALRFWNLTTGKPLFSKHPPCKGPIFSVALSADGRRALSGSEKGEVTLWDMTTGQSRSLGSQQGQIKPHAMAFFLDGRRAAMGGQDRLVHIFDLETGRELAAWTGHDGTISGLAISADGRRLVTGSHDGTVILWDAERGVQLHRFETPDDKGARVAFDSEGHIVAAGVGLGTPPQPGHLIVWDANTYAVLRRDEAGFARHFGMATLPGGRVLTGDSYGIRLWTPRPAGAVASAATSQAKVGEGAVDLIAQIQPGTFRNGQWQIQNNELLSPTTRGARLQFPTIPPPEYRIDLEVERMGDDPGYAFGLGFLVDGRQTELAVDKKNDKGEYLTGFDGVDGVPLQFAVKVHRGTLLLPSRPARFALTVRRDRIDLTCDGARLVDWTGDPKRLIPFRRWQVPDSKLLFLATASAVKFHKITLTPLPGARR